MENVNERDEYIRAYKEFMYNPDNSMNCRDCPENRDFDSYGGNLPCGQQNCWVDCHCGR